MNLLIMESGEVGGRIPRADRRWEHVKKVLRKSPGDTLAAGIAVDSPGLPAPGCLGEALVRELDDSGLVLDFLPFEGEAGDPPPLAPLRLILGFPRPIQAGRILKDLTSLGVSEIELCGTELGEKSYAESRFFKEKDFRFHLLEGAEQAGNPRLPGVRTHWSMRSCLETLAAEESGEARLGSRILLHPYDDPPRLGSARGLQAPVSLAIGSERGWTEAELALLRASGFEAYGLGQRILKTETAVLAATSLMLAHLDLL